MSKTAPQAAPVRVARVGGAVRTFDTPRTLWKRGHLQDDECIIELELPAGETLVYPCKPSHAWNNNKLRASAVRVRDIQTPGGDQTNADVAYAPHVRGFAYPHGERVEPAAFSTETTTTDAPGIHCFATRKGAVHWGTHKQVPRYVADDGGDCDE
jgi:hypothetical protein